MTIQTDHIPDGKPDPKVRTAAAATGMNILLTVLKFLLYFFSGSLAILAEACHSFTDIATSLLVFIAVKRSAAKIREKDNCSGTTGTETLPQTANRLELAISLGIGLILTLLSITLFRKFIQAEPLQVKNALVSGLVFLVFSIGSYIIYRFETRIGKQEGSIGLVSDGMHARADMTASLLTGFSLILYAMGVNLDRWVAGLIALFILSFALETIINVALAYFCREKDSLYKYRSFKIISFLFDKTALQNVFGIFRSFLEKKLGSPGLIKRSSRPAAGLIILLLGLGYFSTALFSVGIREQAIIERFGKPVNPASPSGPGLHMKWPWPVDRVHKIETARIKELNIGNITDKQTLALLWTRAHGTEEAFLSGDNNFFYPYIALHYKVKDISRFLYKNTDPEKLVNEVAHRVATAIFARETFYDIAATHRSHLERTFFTDLQKELDGLQSGIELLAANFKDIHPPISVADAFERVIAGYQEKQKIINDALGYKNDTIPKTHGTAASRLETAQAYISDRTLKAHGKAERFNLSLPESQPEKELEMSRIYLQTIDHALRDKTVIIVDPEAGVPDIWMNLESSFLSEWMGGQAK